MSFYSISAIFNASTSKGTPALSSVASELLSLSSKLKEYQVLSDPFPIPPKHLRNQWITSLMPRKYIASLIHLLGIVGWQLSEKWEGRKTSRCFGDSFLQVHSIFHDMFVTNFRRFRSIPGSNVRIWISERWACFSSLLFFILLSLWMHKLILRSKLYASWLLPFVNQH